MAASYKYIIEKLEVELQEVCDGIQSMECEKMQSMEDSLKEIKDLLFGINQFSKKNTNNTKEKGSTPLLKYFTMDFSRFSRDDLME
jgi:hypothetical protein